MKRFWYEEYGGKGIVPTIEADYFKEGRAIHEDLATIVQSTDPRETLVGLLHKYLDPLSDEVRSSVLEPVYRHCGWLIAFTLHWWPIVSREWEVESVEREIIFEGSADPALPDLWCGVIPDLILRHRVQRYLKYVEYKTTKILSPGWMAYWEYAVQLHMGIRAVEREIGESVRHAEILGLYKGDTRYGRLNHPFTWGWLDGEHFLPAGMGRRGMIPSPVWDHHRTPAGLLGFADRLGPDRLLGLFATSAPVFPDDRKLALLIKARVARELQVAAWRAATRENRANDPARPSALAPDPAVFEPRFTKCQPVVGAPCPYKLACHNYTVFCDPLGSGEYVIRTPHHELELIAEGEPGEDVNG